MLATVRERLTLILIFLLPLHALLVTFGTKLIAGPDHAPLTVLALWKEALLGIILVVALAEIVKMQRAARYKLQADRFDLLILSLVVLGVTVSFLTHQNPALFALGFRYDFLAPCAFLIFRRVPWSPLFRYRFILIVLSMGAFVVVWGIAALFQPDAFFRNLGYSDLHSLYLPDRPLAAFQRIEGSALRRMQSTFSGPNQLGLWLLIPLSLFFAAPAVAQKKIGSYLLMLLLLTGIFLTYSRSAWIAALCVIGIAILARFRPKLRKRQWTMIGAGALLFTFAAAFFSPHVLLRLSSTRGHFERPLEAVHTMIANPLGLGLGAAGPASNRVSDACVVLREGDDPSWAADRPDLCVFVGDAQVQPLNRACNCPLLTENWYLQIGVELGIAGFVLFAALTILVLLRLWSGRQEALTLSALLAFGGLSVGALFLHAWEDTAIAWTVWIVLALALKPGEGARM